MNDDKKLFQNKTFLSTQQYKDSSNLDARAALHRRFSTAKTDWHPWVFDHLNLQPGERVLECGCGPGWLWRDNVNRIPDGCQITLTDLSPGMVAEAEAALAAADADFHFQTASIDDLPFADQSFDVVVANHMLYHVPDRTKALAEVTRVLRENGRFYAATNGNEHMRELTEMGRTLFSTLLEPLQQSRLQSSDSMSLSFRLENGHGQLEPFFSQVELVLYDDELRVTQPQPLVAYALSTIRHEEIPDTVPETLHDYFSAQIAEHGAITITKSTGLFIACL